MKACLALLVIAMTVSTHASPAVYELGGTDFSNWTALKDVRNGTAMLSVPGEVTFRYPDNGKGFIKHGFRMLHEGTRNWRHHFGVCFNVSLPDAVEMDLTVKVIAVRLNGQETEVGASVRLAGAGLHEVSLPWTAFDFNQAGMSFLRFAKGLRIVATRADGSAGEMRIGNARVVQAPLVSIDATVRGKGGAQNSKIEYPIILSNCTDKPQAVALSQVRYGWETMKATIEPVNISLPPRGSATATVKVALGDRVPPGGHEEQLILATANGDASGQKLSFITTSELPHPYILHTASRWNEVKGKVVKFGWAREAQDRITRLAEDWVVPEVATPPKNDPDDTYGPFLFATQVENDLLAAGYSWQLTGNRDHAEKVATFLRRLSDPDDGYPVTLRGCNQSLVQEGGFFQHVAMAYDMILDANVLSDADRTQIENTFRIYMETIERQSENGQINNWNLAEVCGAFYCALAMQDLVAAERFFSGPAGIKEQLAKGTMDDGWWYECSISYNMWCASEFTQVAMAYEPFGVNFKDMLLPANNAPYVLLQAELNGGQGVESDDPKMKGKPFGMDPSIYGPTRRPVRQIRDLWDSLLPFIDYRGVMFGVNDSTETNVGGYRREVSAQPFEIAYYAFRDPKYAAMIKRGGGPRDLLYAMPELPEKTPEQFRESAYADNVGLVMLRSQTANRPIREQIQAVLHYGTHGWAHGHFDRTNFLSLMRYGRSFYNPEMVWYSYEPFMYKFYVQNSVAHNMVTVDQKLQEPTPGKRLLFHTGKAMQATAVETTARWCNPPYGGMVYDYVPVKTFEEKTWREGRHVPIPNDPPRYGTLTDFSEPILQRRLMIVTDDYVLVADYVKGDKPHVFENLLQIKGFLGLTGENKKELRHDRQWNADPLGSAQFITDCKWYSLVAPSLARFEMKFGRGADNAGTRVPASEDGVLKLDVHSLWPKSQQLMIGTAPEEHRNEKRLFYTVRGDGKALAEGRVGAWILGKGEIDVSVDGVKRVQLETRTELSKRPTLFWAGGTIKTRKGEEISLSHLPLKFENVAPVPESGRDYEKGPVKIVGELYGESVAAEPKDAQAPGVITVDLSGVDAVRFIAVVGSDYPIGDEAQRRKTFASRVQGDSARFLTIIEPHEENPVIVNALAESQDQIRVELKDGRSQVISIENFTGDGEGIRVRLEESRGGMLIRSESTSTVEEAK